MKESDFQKGVIDEIHDRFPGSLILKNDPNYKQGIPDLTVLYKDKWGMLEVKKSYEAYQKSRKKNFNQEYYINKLNEMSFASFIYPENKEEVLNAMERSFKGHTKRISRVSRSKQVLVA